MKHLFFFVLLVLVTHAATAQVSPTTSSTGPNTAQHTPAVYESMRREGHIEQMPVFEGGTEGLLCFLHQNNQLSLPGSEYPSGKVFVGFIVDTAGQVQGAQILKSLHPALDAEALRLVNLLSGRFTPGRQNKRPVAVPFTLPIQFPTTIPTGRKQLKRFKRCTSHFTANTR